MSLANQDILDQLADALAECPEPGEEIYSSAVEWPPWCDAAYWEPIDYLGVEGEDLEVFVPSEADCDALERLTYQRRYGCNSRWV